MSDTVYTCDIILDEKTGDQILQFPDKMMEELDWRTDDVLGFETAELEGKTSIIIRNISLEKRKEK
jgi:hypothetical protein